MSDTPAPPVVAVDGPAASGKGTLARRLAKQFDFAYLDTGKLYRAVGMKVVRSGGDPEDEDAAEAAARALDISELEDPALSGDDAASAASKVAAIPGVRAALLEFQRTFAAVPPDGKPGAVLDGRDIGTVIAPDATVKLFATASVEVRADRRHKELINRGEASIYAHVLEELKARDARDMNRAAAPLVAASDAVVLDTSDLGIDEAFAAALRIVEGPVQKALEARED
ncbi:(d)CMP kinase [Rhodospirillaceae bacterium KN72]|uniref:Cytidylate kinase n=1 Tax=Pacificispira spongiicola TaxID=2729598 RepID=A0A7Y0HGC0_9PROT|nr:(d)CMP kinase [Pacificispira spongiicola]NMM44767.1 (d)CMP kinase [Pacificispira spongiicola]